MPEDFLRLLGMWALVHELADDAWKAAVERGRSGAPESGTADPIDGLAALVASEKDRLREALESGDLTAVSADNSQALDEMRFEIGELRGRLESMETTLDAIARRLEAE
jgi:hypothetical protein